MANIMTDPKQLSSSTKKRLSLVRLIEFVCSGLALLVLSPLLLAIGTAVKVTSPGPVITRVRQDGRRGRTLTRHKFRTTYMAKDDKGTRVSAQGEHAITPLGRILRATRLDELPRPMDLFLGPTSQDSQTLREQFMRGYPIVLLKMRNRHFFVFDIVALLLIPTFAMILRLDGLSWWSKGSRAVIAYTVVALIVQLIIFYRMGLYNRYWQYAGITELNQVALAVGASAVLLTTLNAVVHFPLAVHDLATYRSLPLIAGLLVFVAVGGSRFGVRGIYHWLRRQTGGTVRRRILVVGAGEAGKMVVREIRTNSVLNMEAVAFVDDDLHKVGTRIAGLPVVGTLEMIPRLADELELGEVIVAIPSAPLGRQHDIITLCRKNGIGVSSLPGLFEILAGYKTISPIPHIDLNSLLDRQPIKTDQSDIGAVLHGAKVLVTGAGGSIGSELCRQIARFDPAEIILLGHGENSIFEISLNLTLAFPDLTNHPVIVDVRDASGIDWAFKRYRPDVIFHAAAHKHVPFMEDSASEAITNNVQGTLNVLRAAQRYAVPRLVLISSDKAVNPTSIMGATKRIAELLVKAAARESGRAYMAVRFGNVLGSRGSVVPVFQWQIQTGGPLRITHPDMRRYFMTIPEAVQLVLQAATLGEGGETFTLDMGEPVRIMDLATGLIRRSGLKIGRDIEIVYSGIRPGEKLVEELFLKSEMYVRKHQKLFVAVSDDTVDIESLDEAVAKLIDLAQKRQLENLVEQMQAIIPDYRPQGRGPERKSVAAQPKTTTILPNLNLHGEGGRA